MTVLIFFWFLWYKLPFTPCLRRFFPLKQRARSFLSCVSVRLVLWEVQHTTLVLQRSEHFIFMSKVPSCSWIQLKKKKYAATRKSNTFSVTNNNCCHGNSRSSMNVRICFQVSAVLVSSLSKPHLPSTQVSCPIYSLQHFFSIVNYSKLITFYDNCERLLFNSTRSIITWKWFMEAKRKFHNCIQVWEFWSFGIFFFRRMVRVE